jgi:ribosomal protein S18 acetylase RimI-like enzyme
VIRDFAADGELVCRHSETESRRFGFSVARLLIPFGPSHSDDEVIALVRRSSNALLIVRAESTRTSLFRELRALGDFESLHADTLCYYHWAVANTANDDQSQSRVSIKRGTEWRDVDVVLTKSFQEYKNHYSMNPRLASGVTVNAYQEWAANLMQDPDSVTLIARDHTTGQALGFVLLTVDEPHSLAEVALNAVQPGAQRGGVYSALMRSAREHLACKTDVRDLYISTQIGNTAVIAAWRKIGLTPHIDLCTYHLMRRDAFGGAATP